MPYEKAEIDRYLSHLFTVLLEYREYDAGNFPFVLERNGIPLLVKSLSVFPFNLKGHEKKFPWV